MSQASPLVKSERRASMCPDCKTVRGNPIANLISAGQQTLTFRCPECGSIWETVRPEKVSTLS